MKRPKNAEDTPALVSHSIRNARKLFASFLAPQPHHSCSLRCSLPAFRARQPAKWPKTKSRFVRKRLPSFSIVLGKPVARPCISFVIIKKHTGGVFKKRRGVTSSSLIIKKPTPFNIFFIGTFTLVKRYFAHKKWSG